MTPEELRDEILISILIPHELSYDEMKIAILDKIQQAKSEWCKEQREKCVNELCEEENEHDRELIDAVKYLILNAPEPE